MRRMFAAGAAIVVCLVLGGPALAQSPSASPAASAVAVPRPAMVSGTEHECYGSGSVTCLESLSDPRVSGYAHYVIHEDCSAGGCVYWGTLTIDGPDGSWTGPWAGVWDNGLSKASSLVLLKGTEAYDGWAFVGHYLERMAGDPAVLNGVIYNGSPPPMEWPPAAPAASPSPSAAPSVSAQEVSPAGSPVEGVTVETLFEVTLGADALPAPLAGVLVFRKLYPADQEISYGADFIPPNSFVRYVESGHLGLRPHDDMAIIRGGTTPPAVETVPAETDATVGPGDTFVMANVPFEQYGKDALGTMWHEGSEDAQVVGFAIRETSRCCAMTHAGMLSPWHATLSGPKLEAMIGQSITFRMSKVHLAPGATLALAADEPPTMRLVDAGTLSVTIPGADGGEEEVRTFVSGQTLADSAFVPGVAPLLGNAGTDPVIVLQLVIEPAAPGATPIDSASPAPSPSQ